MRRQIWSIILSEVAEKEMTVLVSSHNLVNLRMCVTMSVSCIMEKS